MPVHSSQKVFGDFLRSAIVGLVSLLILVASFARGQTPTAHSENQNADAPGGRLYIAGNYLYVAGSCDGMQILDISDPARPRWVGGWRHPGSWCAKSVYATGKYAYVASYFGGLEILDVRDPRTPFSVGRVATGGFAEGVHVAGRYAYMADGTAGLQVVDISNPGQPVHIGRAATSFPAESVQTVGDFAYVGCGPDGLQIFDLTNPAKPALVSKSCPDPIGCHTLQVVNTKAYIASYQSEKMCILDVSDRTKPVILGTRELGGCSQGICVDGQRVYASTFIRKSGLSIIDVAQPEQPKILGTCPTSEWVWDVRIAGNYAYLMDREYNIRVMDVSDAAKPKEVGFFSRNGYSSRPLALQLAASPKPGSPSGKQVVVGNETPKPVSPLPSGGISDAPPELLAPRRAADGSFVFTLVGVPQATYVVHASSDLAQWSAISTNVLPATGMIELTDSKAGQFDQRYYRAVRQ